MILWRSKPTTETEIRHEDLGRRSWRRVLEVTPGFISFHKEARAEKKCTEWWGWSEYIVLSWDTKWMWGSYHFYYDGPHCSLSLGWMTLAWQNWKCKRCCP